VKVKDRDNLKIIQFLSGSPSPLSISNLKTSNIFKQRSASNETKSAGGAFSKTETARSTVAVTWRAVNPGTVSM
jgi:hypothetical protein